MLASYSPDLVSGLPLAIGIVALIVALPTLIGTAISVARVDPTARWNAMGVSVIVALVIAGVSTELIGLVPGLIAGASGLVGGLALGGLVGSVVRARRRRARG